MFERNFFALRCTEMLSSNDQPVPANQPASTLTDEKLMSALGKGDESAFHELFLRYQQPLRRAMARDLYTPEEANDLVQQAFLQLYRSRFDFDPKRKLKPWLYAIALNLKRDYFRRSKHRIERSLDEIGTAPLPEATLQERVDAVRDLGTALRTLPAAQREVIELHWFDGLSFAEIALSFDGTTVGALKLRAHRGYVAIRGCHDAACANVLLEHTAKALNSPPQLSEITLRVLGTR